MAKSILDIVIKLSKQGGADKETLKGLVQLKSGIMEAAAVAGGLVAAGYTIKKAFDATVGATVAYAKEVRSLSEISGASAEETSRLIQVAGDFFISTEQLTKATKALTNQGLTPSLETLAMLADQYVAIQDPIKQNEFLFKNFGKAGLDMAQMLSKGGDALLDMGEGVEKNLILTQKTIDQAREYELAIESLKGAWEDLTVGIGTKFLPAVTQTIEGLALSNQLFMEQQRIMESGEQGYSRAALYMAAINIQEKNQTERTMEADAARMNGLASLYASTDAIKAKTEATEEDVEALKAETEVNKEFLGILGSVNSTYQGYLQETKDLEQERADLFAEKAGLIAQGYSEQSEQVQEVNAKIAENQTRTTEAANQFEIDNKRILLGYLERKLTADGTLDDKELLWLTEKGVAWGVYHATAVEETRAMVNEANALMEGLKSEHTFTLSLNAIYNTGGNDGAMRAAGGGARNARGSNGVQEVPAGFPNDSFPVWMTSGETYQVNPPWNSGFSNMASSGGGGAVNLTVNINSMINTADREKVKSEMLPVILDGVRSLQAEGRLR